MDQLIARITASLEAIQKRATIYRAHGALMDQLIAKGEARRLGRTSDIVLKNVRYSGGKVTAEAVGSKGDTYQVRINLAPPGHKCTCADWKQRGPSVGPCKHVLRLAEYWREERILPQLEKLDGGLERLLS